MSFWDKAIGNSNPNPPTSVQPAQTVPSKQPWWRPEPTPSAVQQPNQVPAEGITVDMVKARASAAKTSADGRCPECNSGNYIKSPAHLANTPAAGMASPRCFDCGYPRLQMASGMSSMSEGRSTPAKQVSTANNYNPNVIVDRIG